MRARSKHSWWLIGALLFCLQANAQSVKAIEYFFDVDPGAGNGTRINLNPATSIDTTVIFNTASLAPGLHQLFIRALDADNEWSLYQVYPVLTGIGNANRVIEKIEYFFNADPGVGNGIQLSVNPAAVADVSATLDLSSLPDGLHQVYIRAMDNAGKWSLYHTYPVIKGPGITQPLVVQKMEFFIDVDPGVGKGTPVPVNAAYSIDSTFILQLPNTDRDTVHLYIRAMDNRGLWGLYHDTMVSVTCSLYKFKPDFTFSPVLPCLGTPVQFSDTSKASEWHWSFSSTDSSTLQNPVHNYFLAGNYEVRLYVVNARGCVSDTARKTLAISAPPSVDAGPDLQLYVGEQATLNPVAGGSQLQFAWSPDEYMSSAAIRNPVITATEDIQYYVTVTNAAGCSATDSLKVQVLKETKEIKVPNIFTPNGDGVNDNWTIQFLNTYTNCRVQIFNRYGQKVFESIGYGKPWNGMYNNQPVPFGTYYYIIEPRKGMKALTGYVTIVR